jgi:predicted kinase
MYDRLLKIKPGTSHSILLLGPRGTGKAYWIKKSFPNAYYIDLLHSKTYTSLNADPSRARIIGF